MSKRHLLIAVLLLPFLCLAQESRYPFKIESVRVGRSFQLQALNQGPLPITVKMDVQGSGLVVDPPAPLVRVIRPQSMQYLASVFSASPDQGFQFNTSYSFAIGKPTEAISNTPYRMPYPEGTSAVISQAFNGPITTHNTPESRYAVDFTLPIGTAVVAARSGTVIEVVDHWTDGGLTEFYKDKANRVIIMHEDGTQAIYAHLSPGQYPVSVGQRVELGQVIAYSGNTGYSSGPHLHFCVQRMDLTPEGGFAGECIPFRLTAGLPAVEFVPQSHLEVLATYSSPAQIRNLDDVAQVADVSDPQLGSETFPTISLDMGVLKLLGRIALVLATLGLMKKLFGRKKKSQRVEPTFRDWK